MFGIESAPLSEEEDDLWSASRSQWTGQSDQRTPFWWILTARHEARITVNLWINCNDQYSYATTQYWEALSSVTMQLMERLLCKRLFCYSLASCRLLRHSLVRNCIPVAPSTVEHYECTFTKYLFTYD